VGRLLAVVHCDDVIAAETRAAGTRKLRPFHGRVMHHQPGYVIHVQHVTPALADLISLIDKGLLQNCVTHSLHKPLCATLKRDPNLCIFRRCRQLYDVPSTHNNKKGFGDAVSFALASRPWCRQHACLSVSKAQTS